MRTAIKNRWRRNPIDALEPIRVTCSGTNVTVAEPKVPNQIYLASLVINLLALGLPLVSLQVYDRIIPHHAHDTLAFLIVGLAVALLLDLALRTARSALLGWYAMGFVRDVEREAITRLIHASQGTIEWAPVAVHLNRFAALAGLGSYHAGSSRLTAIDIPFVLVTLAIISVVGGVMVVAPIVLFLLFAGLAVRRSLVLRKNNEERSIQDNKKYDFVSEVLAGILTIKGMAMEPQMLRRFERLQQSVAETTMRAVLISTAGQSSAATYGSLSQILIVAFGATRVIDGDMSIGALACCAMLSGQALQPLLRAMSLWAEHEILRQRRAEVRKLLALPAAELPPRIGISIQGAIQFAHVKTGHFSWNYPR
jgi:ATP-binding cassette subfamily C protein LapB